MRLRTLATLVLALAGPLTAAAAKPSSAQPSSASGSAAPSGSAASNPTPQELAAARKLFAEALREQEAGRYEQALEKYERVRQVKDTAPIRYRIGSCEEALSHLRRAVRAYAAAVELGQGNTSEADVVRASRERLEALAKKAARLQITLRGHTQDAKVAVDDEALEKYEIDGGVWLDPGNHVVTATAPDASPSRTEISLSAGGRVSLTVDLQPQQPETPPAPTTASTVTPPVPTASATITPPPPHETPPSSSPTKRTWGFIALGAGGVLVVASGIVFILRHSDIVTLQNDCPAGSCPANQESEITSIHKRAQFEGPLGTTLLLTGLVAAGVGGALVLTSQPSSSTPSSAAAPRARLAPMAGPHALGLSFEGAM